MGTGTYPTMRRPSLLLFRRRRGGRCVPNLVRVSIFPICVLIRLVRGVTSLRSHPPLLTLRRIRGHSFGSLSFSLLQAAPTWGLTPTSALSTLIALGSPFSSTERRTRLRTACMMTGRRIYVGAGHAHLVLGPREGQPHW